MEELAKILKEQREAAGLRQVDLAEQSGVSLRTIQGWERGKVSDFARFVAVLSALGYDVRPFAPLGKGRPRKE